MSENEGRPFMLFWLEQPLVMRKTHRRIDHSNGQEQERGGQGGKKENFVPTQFLCNREMEMENRKKDIKGRERK